MGQVTCSIADCSRTVLARGWCGAHYQRWRKSGNPLVAKFERGPLELLWKHVELGRDDECWNYTGKVNKRGYARFKHHWVHRLAWELQRGPIPEGLTVDHLCFNKVCTNPQHLEIVPLKENLRRRRTLLDKGICIHGHLIEGEKDVRRSGNHVECMRCLQVKWKARYHKKERVSSHA